MKWKYYIFLTILFLIFIGPIVVLRGQLDFSTWIATSATFVATFAALAAGIIAIGVADVPLRFVKFDVSVEIDEQNIKTYNPVGLPDKLRRGADNKSFHSYRVYFKIINKSGFTLKNPVTTFRLPTNLMHPLEIENKSWIPYYSSSIYNVQIDLRELQYEDTIVLSNSLLPFLNDDQELPVWIRMCLLKEETKSYIVMIDLNCDNAEGSTKEVIITPNLLLKDFD